MKVVTPRISRRFGLDGDLVEVELLPEIPGERREGRVIRVVESAREEFVGKVKKDDRWGKKRLCFTS